MGNIDARFLKFGKSTHDINMDLIPSGDLHHALTTDDQTIFGVKTFAAVPMITGDPTNASHLVSKSWVLSSVVEKTKIDLIIYINSGNTYIDAGGDIIGAGNDETGLGTKNDPYASLQHAIDVVPKYLSHDVTIVMCGLPFRYTWMIDGSDGICFSSGTPNTSVRVKRPTGKNTVISVSGSAIEITPKNGGDSIANICALLKTNAPTLIEAVVVGNKSAVVTTALATTSLSGGELRSYEPITISGFSGSGTLFVRVIDNSSMWERNLAACISSTSNDGILVLNNSAPIHISGCEIKYLGSSNTTAGIRISSTQHVLIENCTILGGWHFGINILNGSTASVSQTCINSCAYAAVQVNDCARVVVGNCFGKENIRCHSAISGQITRYGTPGISGTTSDSKSLGGQIWI